MWCALLLPQWLSIFPDSCASGGECRGLLPHHRPAPAHNLSGMVPPTQRDVPAPLSLLCPPSMPSALCSSKSLCWLSFATLPLSVNFILPTAWCRALAPFICSLHVGAMLCSTSTAAAELYFAQSKKQLQSMSQRAAAAMRKACSMGLAQPSAQALICVHRCRTIACASGIAHCQHAVGTAQAGRLFTPMTSSGWCFCCVTELVQVGVAFAVTQLVQVGVAFAV